MIISTAEEAKSYFGKWKGMNIKKIANLGSCNFYEHPLFIYTDQFVYSIFFDYESISIQSYKTEEFESNISNGIFRRTQNGLVFDYINPNYKMIESPVSDIQITSYMSNGTAKPRQIKLVLKKQKTLYIEYSNIIPETMDAWIE